MNTKQVKHTTILLCMIILFSMGNVAFAEEALTTEETSSTENTELEDNSEEDTQKLITLTYYDGEEVWKSTSAYGDSVKAEVEETPTAPGREYQFLYWEYMKDGEMVEVTEDTVFYEDTDLYAHWKILKKITLTYYYDSETVWKSVSEYDDSVKVRYKDGPPSAPGDGYFFLYWEYMKDGEMVKVTEDTLFYEDTNLYACWQVLIDPNYANVLKTMEENEKKAEIEKKLKSEKKYAAWIKNYKPKIISVKNNKKKAVSIKFSLADKKAGYKIQYSTSKKFKKAKTITVKSTKNKLTKKITKLKRGKTYYIRVRAYRIYDPSKYGSTDPKETYYSKWSKVKKIKVK